MCQLILLAYLLFNVCRVQGVVKGSFGSFVWFPGLNQVNCDPHVDANNLQMPQLSSET